MDPNMLRHIDYFAVPNNQTVNPVDQNQSLGTTATPGENPASIWDTSSLPTEATSASMSLGSAATPNPYVPKTVLPSRDQLRQTREGHERKRSKLSTDAAAPFDSVDYWLDFEHKGEGAGGKGKGVSNTTRSQTAQMAANPSLGNPSKSGMTGTAGNGGIPAPQVDDSALDNALSDDEDELSMNIAEHLSKIESAPPVDVPPREGLYSTPLSWEKPQLGIKADPLVNIHNTPLNEADQQRLIAIAMNPNSTTGGLGSTTGGGVSSNIASTFGPAFGAHAYLGGGMGAMAGMGQIGGMGDIGHIPNLGGPMRGQMQPNMAIPQMHMLPNVENMMGPGGQGRQGQGQARPRPGKQQMNPELPDGLPEVSESGDGSVAREAKGAPGAGGVPGAPGDRTAHNDIERKYRTNLKDKIAELRDAVPALRPIPENAVPEEAEGSTQAGRAPKVSKGTVLTKATEYIHWLERRNKAIVTEHNELSRRLQAFEQLLNATTRQSYTMPNYSRTLFDPRGFC